MFFDYQVSSCLHFVINQGNFTGQFLHISSKKKVIKFFFLKMVKYSALMIAEKDLIKSTLLATFKKF